MKCFLHFKKTDEEVDPINMNSNLLVFNPKLSFWLNILPGLQVLFLSEY